MSKRQILAAAKRKGVSFALLDWSIQTTPGGTVGCWEAQIDEATEAAALSAGHDVANLKPSCCGPLAEVLAWIETLPNLLAEATP